MKNENQEANLQIGILNPNEGHVLDNVAEGVFDYPIDHRWFVEFLNDPRHHLAVAIDDQQVVGMASSVDYVHPDKAPELWINEVGVAPSHRGRGVASQLLRCLFQHGLTLGCKQAWVLTESNNSAARNLYVRAGGKKSDETPVCFSFYLDSES